MRPKKEVPPPPKKIQGAPHLGLLVLVQRNSRGLGEHAQHLERLHAHHFGDLALLHQKRGVVDVELHRLEQRMDVLERLGVAIDQHLGLTSAVRDVARHAELLLVLVTGRRVLAVAVVEPNSDGRARDARLTFLVHQCAHILHTQLARARHTQHEHDGVEDVGLAGSIATGDGIEAAVKRSDLCQVPG